MWSEVMGVTSGTGLLQMRHDLCFPLYQVWNPMADSGRKHKANVRSCSVNVVKAFLEWEIWIQGDRPAGECTSGLYRKDCSNVIPQSGWWEPRNHAAACHSSACYYQAEALELGNGMAWYTLREHNACDNLTPHCTWVSCILQKSHMICKGLLVTVSVGWTPDCYHTLNRSHFPMCVWPSWFTCISISKCLLL